jgi:metal-responsive CopG/Arc/MetJ family transcriptional regulator
MRITIEIKEEYRAKLLEIAARRGEKGFCEIVEEALERYLESEAENEAARHVALRVRGTISPKEADELRARTRTTRESWR